MTTHNTPDSKQEACQHLHAANYDPAKVVRGQPIPVLGDGRMWCYDCKTFFTPDHLVASADPLQPTGEQELTAAFNKHLAQRHEELAMTMRETCTKVLDLIEQYTRPDFYMWLLHDYAGQNSDPYKRAAEAKGLLTELLNSKPSTRTTATPPPTPSDAAMRAAEEIVKLTHSQDINGGTKRITTEIAAIITRHLAAKEANRLFEAKLLGFGENDRIRLCGPCMKRATEDDFVIFGCALPLDIAAERKREFFDAGFAATADNEGELSNEALMLKALKGCGCEVDLVWCSACVNAWQRKVRDAALRTQEGEGK